MSPEGNRTWRINPIDIQILKSLDKRDGILLDSELYRIIEKDFPSVSENEIDEILMSLEIKGIIHVAEIKKNVRKITRINEEMAFLPVGED